MSELIQRLREYWCDNTAVARRAWRNERGEIAVIESDTHYPSVVILVNSKQLTIFPYVAWDKYLAIKEAEAIAQLAGAEEVSEPMERRSGM